MLQNSPCRNSIKMRTASQLSSNDFVQTGWPGYLSSSGSMGQAGIGRWSHDISCWKRRRINVHCSSSFAKPASPPSSMATALATRNKTRTALNLKPTGNLQTYHPPTRSCLRCFLESSDFFSFSVYILWSLTSMLVYFIGTVPIGSNSKTTVVLCRTTMPGWLMLRALQQLLQPLLGVSRWVRRRQLD